MRKFSTGGYTFYILQRNERAPNPLADTGFCGAYLIWPLRSGLWDVRQFEKGRWEQLTNDFFDSENAAFNHVYKKYCDEYNLSVIKDVDKEYLKKIIFLECY
ncbi:hypothetical protein [Pantoea agglomerans]|uniref:hypothetical protein n=1 Tax=Enterobacter agglomerans TaxID=549 RepID=UPI003DA020FD